MWKNKIKKAKEAEPESPNKEQQSDLIIETELIITTQQLQQQEQLQQLQQQQQLSSSSSFNLNQNIQNNNLNLEEEGNGITTITGTNKRNRQSEDIINDQNNGHNNNVMINDINSIHNNHIQINNNNNNQDNNNNINNEISSNEQQNKRMRSNNDNNEINSNNNIMINMNNNNNNQIIETYGSNISMNNNHNNHIINGNNHNHINGNINNNNNNNNHNMNNHNINMNMSNIIGNDESMQSIHYQYESRSSKASKRDQNWDSQFEALLAYANKHKHCNVRTCYLTNEDERPHVNLYAWLALQRRHKKQNKLRPDREKKLQSLVDAGMLSWSGSESNSRNDDEEEYIHVLPPPPPPSWESHFAELLIYSELYGHANVPLGYLVTVDKRKDIDLGHWLEEQRKQYLRKTSDNTSNFLKLNILAEEGRFSWQTPRTLPTITQQILDAKWSYRFEAMRNFILQDENKLICLGDNIKANLVVPVPESTLSLHSSSSSTSTSSVEVFDLGLWVTAQRKCYAAGVLNEKRKSLLQLLVDSNQFTWQSKEEEARISAEDAKRSKEEEALWNAWYNALVWQGNHVGHCNLDSHGTITLPDGSEAELGKWLHIQRAHIKKGKLRPDRAKKIKKLYDEGKLHPSRWAHVFNLNYPSGTFDDLSNQSIPNISNVSTHT